MNVTRTIATPRSVSSPTFQPKPKSAPIENQDWFDAGSLMEERGIELDGRSLMRENLATYLAHRPKGSPMPTGRWEVKLNRDLENPYTDEQVFQQVDKLQNSLKENLEALPSYPKSVFVTGSFSKGRLGANSDLNGYAVLPADQFDTAFEGFQTRHQAGEGANLFPMSENSPGFNKGMMLVEGTSLKISTDRLQEDGYLREVYTDLLASPKQDRVEASTKLDGITGKMWRSKFERETFHFKAMRWALHFGGTLSRVPLLGSLVDALGSKVIAQDHRDLTTS